MDQAVSVLGGVGLLLFIVGCLVGNWIGVARTSSIESPTRIEPEIKLIIKDNKPDTVFVYKLK